MVISVTVIKCPTLAEVTLPYKSREKHLESLSFTINWIAIFKTEQNVVGYAKDLKYSAMLSQHTEHS